MANTKKMKKKTANLKKFKRRWIIILSIVLFITIAVNVLLNVFSGHADIYLGRGQAIISQAEGTENWASIYYENDYSNYPDLQAASNELVQRIESEGIVLLKNNGALPLVSTSSNGARITLLGRDAVDPVYGGSGSGSVDLSSVIDLKTALEDRNFNINETVYSELMDFASYSVAVNQFGAAVRSYENPKANIVMDRPSASTYYIGEMPADDYSANAIRSFDNYNDAAVVVFGRGGGEGGDLATDMKGFDENYQAGQHQLELNKDEKDLLELAKAHFDTVVVIINSSSAMELGVLEEDPGIDSVLWIGSPGQTGFYAVADVLNGTINPSGKTADIYAADFTADPTFVNFGHYQYRNVNRATAYDKGYFVQYEEGLYFGYRYYETAAVEGFLDYNQAVVYPFGYGLSYTSFDWEIVSQNLGDVDGTITVDVKVTNTGSEYSGKEVVQLYYSAPYYEGGIEKSSIVLGDFAKTGLLAPGESDTVTLSLAVEEMASYDYEEARAYVLEEGDYSIRIQTDSHHLKEGLEEIIYTVNQTIVYDGSNHRSSDKAPVTNQFDDMSDLFSDEPQEGSIINMSRADFAGTFPTAPEGDDLVARDEIVAAFQAYLAEEHTDPDLQMPVTGVESGLSLIDMRGRSMDDPAWDALLDELDPEDIVEIVTNSAYTTAAIESIGKPTTIDLDGPAGISAFMGDIHGTAFPSEVVIASTFNKELAREMGVMIGNEGLFYGVHGWYAPAVNLHRSPFAGRNFEYYSEDPVLSGKLATAVVSGAAEKGVYTFLKHYALNDQETNRNNNGVASWANEQVFREIYLKPFEMVVKNAKANIKYIADAEGTMAEKEMNASTAIMSSFNRIGATWAGGSIPLMQNVLRDEWGFEGVAISDFNLYDHMFVNQGLAAGTDVNITFSSMKSMEDTSSATAVSQLRRSAHRLLYTVAHSHAMNGLVPGATVSYTMAPWRIGLIIADVLIILLVALAVLRVVNRVKKEELIKK